MAIVEGKGRSFGQLSGALRVWLSSQIEVSGCVRHFIPQSHDYCWSSALVVLVDVLPILRTIEHEALSLPVSSLRPDL
jgi:hypothetical protein